MSDQPVSDGQQQSVSSGSDGSPPWKLILLVIVVAGLVTFFFQNGSDTAVHFLWLDGSWPVWSVIAISVGIGIVLDRLFSWQWRRARRRKDTDG
jgi:protein-S-isoprenylcysteine O-methyltransferase Ste14